MTKEEFTQKTNLLQQQMEDVRNEYLATNRPIEPGKLVTVYEGQEEYFKGLLTGYKLVGKTIYFEIAPLTKNGTPHKSQRRSYDILDTHFKVVPGVTM